jgi:hypothetical protein
MNAIASPPTHARGRRPGGCVPAPSAIRPLALNRTPAPFPSVDRARRQTSASSRVRRRARSTGPARLGHYRDRHGRQRELVALRGHAGSLLVVDRDAATLRDRRLVAHLGAEEPAGNAQLVCGSYLSSPRGRWCRRLHPGDLLAAAPGEPAYERDRQADADAGSNGGSDAAQPLLLAPTAPIRARGYLHRLEAIEHGRSTVGRSRVELRWCRRPDGSKQRWEPVALREVVAALESYEPARGLTAAAISRHDGNARVSLRRLRGEYRWLCTTPMVLNLGLREAVQGAIDRGELSMSEIALRCGVVKRDRHGKPSGETSWLARRVGLMPEGGAKRITPWVHSDVLALIAREGLRLSPREVEVP